MIRPSVRALLVEYYRLSLVGIRTDRVREIETLLYGHIEGEKKQRPRVRKTRPS